MDYISTILAVVFGLMVVTNIVVEVLKKITRDKVSTNLLVIVVAEVLTLVSGAAYASINDIAIAWYHVVAAVILGIFVAYSAMFGFDKLRQAAEQVGRIKMGKTPE